MPTKSAIAKLVTFNFYFDNFDEVRIDTKDEYLPVQILVLQ